MNTRITLAMVSGLALSASALAGEPAPAPAPAKAPASTPSEADKAKPALGNTTSEAAIKLFIKAMAEGDFNKVVQLTDPGSEAIVDIQQMAEAFNPDTANKNISKAQLDMVKSLFTKPWIGAEPKLVVEQGPRAQYEVRFFGADPKTGEKIETEKKLVDLNLFDGQWRVLASGSLLKPAVPKDLQDPGAGQPAPKQAPAQAPTAPAQGKPAGSH